MALPFLNSALDVGEWLASRSVEGAPRYPLDRRLGGPGTGMDAVVKVKRTVGRVLN
jgi:hypothetical protein